MARHRLLDPGKLALGVDNAHLALGAQGRQAEVVVVRDKELLRGRLVEALQAAQVMFWMAIRVSLYRST